MSAPLLASLFRQASAILYHRAEEEDRLAV